MSIQHYTTVRTIARAAEQFGATLPKDITTALDHLETISRTKIVLPQPGPIAADLAQHLGNPAAMEKARKAAALALATAEANAKIDAHLAETCGTRLRALMRRDAEQIAAAFGDALVDDLAALQTEAPKLPAWFKPTQADRLDPATYEAWTRARDAHDHISAAQNALGVLYGGAIAHQHAEQFPILAAHSLRFAKPPTFRTQADAYAFRDALQGRVSPAREGAAHGPVSVDGIFIPTLLAHAGATFEWATPSEVTDRAADIVNAMTHARGAA